MAVRARLGHYFRELRAPFFTGSIVPVLVGTALARHEGSFRSVPLFLLALAGTMALHAGANVANDYFDHASGNDAANRDFVRPFTGGSRLIQRGLLSPREVLAESLVCFGVALAVVVALAAMAGWGVLAFAASGALGGWFYTAPPLRLTARGLGELVVALDFGVLPVLGAYWLQAERLSWVAVLAATPVALLIAAVLFNTQYQDAAADASTGRRNWVVRLGRKRASTVYAGLAGAWAVPLVAGVAAGWLPPAALAALAPLPLAWRAAVVARRHHDDPRALAPANAMTILLHFSVGLLLAGGLAWT